MMQKTVDAKISPEMAMFVQLDEINGRLKNLTDLIETTTAEGKFFTRVISVTDQPHRINFKAFGYTLFNDGDDTVYTSDQGPQVDTGSITAGLEANEHDVVNFNKRAMVELWIACAAGGTATVRIRGIT